MTFTGSIIIITQDITKSYLISSQDVSFKKKKNRNIQNTENGYSNGLFTSVRLMTSFLTHHQRPKDYTIECQQRLNGTKNMNIIVLL